MRSHLRPSSGAGTPHNQGGVRCVKPERARRDILGRVALTNTPPKKYGVQRTLKLAWESGHARSIQTEAALANAEVRGCSDQALAFAVSQTASLSANRIQAAEGEEQREEHRPKYVHWQNEDDALRQAHNLAQTGTLLSPAEILEGIEASVLARNDRSDSLTDSLDDGSNRDPSSSAKIRLLPEPDGADLETIKIVPRDVEHSAPGKSTRVVTAGTNSRLSEASARRHEEVVAMILANRSSQQQATSGQPTASARESESRSHEQPIPPDGKPGSAPDLLLGHEPAEASEPRPLSDFPTGSLRDAFQPAPHHGVSAQPSAPHAARQGLQAVAGASLPVTFPVTLPVPPGDSSPAHPDRLALPSQRPPPSFRLPTSPYTAAVRLADCLPEPRPAVSLSGLGPPLPSTEVPRVIPPSLNLSDPWPPLLSPSGSPQLFTAPLAVPSQKRAGGYRPYDAELSSLPPRAARPYDPLSPVLPRPLSPAAAGREWQIHDGFAAAAFDVGVSTPDADNLNDNDAEVPGTLPSLEWNSSDCSIMIVQEDCEPAVVML